MDGYLYCFSNESIPSMLKIGSTKREPNIRLNEANSNTWIPLPYKLEFAKKVLNHKQKEMLLHKILSQYNKRVNPRREFFYISKEEAKAYFDLIDGETWINNINEKNEDNEDNEDIEYKSESENNEKIDNKQIKKRDATKCFTNCQRIRHIIGIDKIWIGIYDLSNNSIIYEDKIFNGKSPLNRFVKAHYELERNDRTSSANAWYECECEINGQWVSTYNL